MRRGVRAALVTAATAIVALASLGSGARVRAGVDTSPPDYERDVAPILREHCVSCHGAKEPESDLRLDSRAAVLAGGMSGPVLVAGRSAESLLVRHLDGRASPRMPHRKPPLPADQIARLAAWIDAGAPGRDEAPAVAAVAPKPALHWAYVKPVRPAVPGVVRAEWVRSPIDAFVLARLEKEGLSPSPEASRETLVRRLSLDLVGLPPTPGEIDAFLADRSPDAYEKVVDRLLASPHYGERWARPWLDLARYADTNGYEKDQRRTAWKYRDWVIDALDRDLPFRDFTIEQLAGDMLPGATVEQRTATGFHRNTQLNQEGGIDVEEARFETLVDRVNTTGTVWLGTTLACAQCHNHKFDPVSQKDYYRMLAFYDNAEYSVFGQGEEIVDRWIVEPDLELPTPGQAKRREALRREAEALRLEIDGRDLGADLAAFEREIAGPAPVFTPLPPVRFEAKSGASFRKLSDGSLLVSGEVKDKDTYTVTVRAGSARVTAFRLEALPDPSLPRQGPGRAGSGAFVVTGLAVRQGSRAIPLVRAAADVNEKRRSAALLLDGHDDTGWGVTTDEEAGRAHFVVVQLSPRGASSGTEAVSPRGASSGTEAVSPRGASSGTEAVSPRGASSGSGDEGSAAAAPADPPRSPDSRARTLTFTLEFQSGWPHVQSSLGRFRLSATSAKSPFGGLPVPDEVRRVLETPKGRRTAEQEAALLAWFRPLAPSLDTARDRLRTVQAELDEMKVLTTPVLRERAGFERPSTLLRNRGSFMSPGERVYAAVPAALGSLPDDQPPNRLGLARWLVSPDNPLTARVTVNRYWETLFGRGLVATVEDFGTQGERPSHTELLDWLAAEFVEKGWSQKILLREIVTSATYRQSSTATLALRERDPENRLLARGARFRVEAEMVRDVALAASGLLSRKVGGPSVYPLQPEGIWNVPYSSMKWETSAGEDLHRRSLYTFLRRSSPYPGLRTFDAPSREQCTARRVRTNTPLQALTTLNDPVFVEAAHALADRMMAEGGGDAASRVAYGHRLCTARRPGEADLADLMAFYERERTRFAREPESAQALLAGDAGKPGAVERASLTMVANVLLSLDATLTRE